MADLKNLTTVSGEFDVPTGTTDARDSAGSGALSGDVRYNSTNSSMEFFDSATNAWFSFGSQKFDMEEHLATSPEVTIRTFPTDSTASATNGTKNILWAVDCKLTSTSQGMIAEYGGTGHGCAMGIDNGVLRARAYGGDTWGAGSGNDRVLFEADVNEYCGDSATIYFAMETSPYPFRSRLYIQPGGRGSSHYPILLGDDSAPNLVTGPAQIAGYIYIHGGNAKTYGSLFTSVMADLETNYELDYTNPSDIKEIRCYRHDSDLDLTNFAPYATRVKPHPIVASGGSTITTVGQWTFHTFNSNGTFKLTQQAQGVHSTRGTEIRYLAVGGGGGASKGGGGGGGVVTGTLTNVTKGEYTITVGAGGAANNTTDTTSGVDRQGSDGGDTTIAASTGHKGTTSSGFSVTAGGGGGGGGGNVSTDTAWRNGRNGLANNGSGGGGASWFGYGSGGTGNGTGGDGGDGTDNASPYSHGGGGGASADGLDFHSINSPRPNGGNGTTWYMNGVTYGGGGGGGGLSTGTGQYGLGGTGGGADGSYTGGTTNSGTANTGGGGGGRKTQVDTNAGAGGSGIVIIAYRTNPVDD